MALEALCDAFDETDGEEERMDECIPDSELNLLADLLANDEEEELPAPEPRDCAEENVTTEEPRNGDGEESMAAMKGVRKKGISCDNAIIISFS